MTRKTALLFALAAAFPASAVTLNPDGLGQALIYPYYTAQSAGSDAFNTYISVVNHTADAKAVRLRFREGRLGKSVLDMNVYLSPNDVWTGAVVPFSTGTRLVTTDVSCTEPRFAIEFAPGSPPFIDFRNDAFSGSNDDGAGTGLDRTREGFVEIIEMGKLTGTSAAAVTHNGAGIPSNCGAILTGTPLIEPPTGGLSGTLTLINVATGLDFNLNAEALDALASRSFFRRATDSYPDFNVAEIDPVSVVDANGATYRSVWTRPVDAVSAVLMRGSASMEYVLDEATASLIDGVVTLPTRHYYAPDPSGRPLFRNPRSWTANCLGPGPSTQTQIGEPMNGVAFNREEQAASLNGACTFLCLPGQPNGPAICASSGVFSVYNQALQQFANTPRTGPTLVLGSVGGWDGGGTGPLIPLVAARAFSNGWLLFAPGSPLTSNAQSTRLSHATGEVVSGPHEFIGLPMLGFSVRVFRNGTLRCDAGACQGNYGTAFPMMFRRAISP